MKKIVFRSLLLCALLMVLLIPSAVSAKTASATASPTIDVTGGANYKTSVKISLAEIPDKGTAKASEAVSSVSVSLSSYDYLRVKFSVNKGATVTNVIATVTKSGKETQVTLPYYETSGGTSVYRAKIDGTVTVININLKHNCTYDYKQIPATTTKATCTEDGTLSRTCIYCGNVDTQINEKATGHIFTVKKVEEKYLAKEATCTENALYYKSCCTCGEAGTETFAVENTALGHDLSKTEAKAATCTEDGHEAYWTCSECNKLFSDENGQTEIDAPEVIPAAHTWDADYTVDKAPTCTEAGSKSRHCSECGAVTDVTKVSALGHDLSKTEAKAATCTEDGHEAYWTCSECNKLFSDENGQTEIDAPEVIPATGHDLGEWTVKTPPAIGTEGVQERTCEKCDYTEIGVIPALEADEADSDHKPDLAGNNAEMKKAAKADDSAQTGDDSNIAWYAFLMLIAAGGVIGITEFAGKKKRNEL